MNPITRMTDWAISHTRWHRQMQAEIETARQAHEEAMAELEAMRIDLEIDSIIAETRLGQVRTLVKAEIIDDLRALAARNA